MIDDQITARLYVFIRENIKGGCKKFSIGDKCECALCDLDRLLDASNQNTAMNHSELIARLQRIAEWFDLHDEFSFSEEPATIREAADALQALERVWQPIETALKDGRTILLGRYNSQGKWRTMRGRWFSQDVIDEEWEEPEMADEGWYETCVESDDTPNCWWTEPSHWQPLPTPPESK